MRQDMRLLQDRALLRHVLRLCERLSVPVLPTARTLIRRTLGFMRWKGCRCNAHKKPCTGRGACECQRASRECEPNLCACGVE
jgi:hypothetical protein